MRRLAPSLMIVAVVIGGSAVAQTLNPAPETNTRLCDLEAIFASIPVYDECGTVTTTTEGSGTLRPAPTVESSTSAPPLSPGVWSLRADGSGPIWTPPQDEDGAFRWYPNMDGARIAWQTESGEWDWGSRDPDGFDATGPKEESAFHYYDGGWVSAYNLEWRVDGITDTGIPFQFFWTAPVYEPDPLTENPEPADLCRAPYPCVVPPTTVGVYPTTGPA